MRQFQRAVAGVAAEAAAGTSSPAVSPVLRISTSSPPYNAPSPRRLLPTRSVSGGDGHSSLVAPSPLRILTNLHEEDENSPIVRPNVPVFGRHLSSPPPSKDDSVVIIKKASDSHHPVSRRSSIAFATPNTGVINPAPTTGSASPATSALLVRHLARRGSLSALAAVHSSLSERAVSTATADKQTDAIIIVDDEKSTLKICERAFSTRNPSGCKVIPVQIDTQDTVEQAAQRVKDALGIKYKLRTYLSDYSMGIVTGPALLNKLREDGVISGAAYCVGHSASSAEEALQRQGEFEAAGAAAFYRKPDSIGKIDEMLKNAGIEFTPMVRRGSIA